MENPNSVESQMPPPRAAAEPEAPQMSEAATLGSIFFEPGRTFEDLRRKPRFILAIIVIALLSTVYIFGLYYKVGDEGMRRFAAEQVEKTPGASSMNAEQKAMNVNMQMTIGSVVRYAWPLIIAIILFVGGALYWLASKAFGGAGGFLHGVSVFVYSSLPPTVVGSIANFIVLVFKSADEINIATSQRGVIHANPAIFIDGKASPVLATLIGTLDLFMIWGWVLAAIGLRITNKLSSGSAWAIVLIFALIGIFVRVIGAFFSGNPA
jgi:hypothetical protein